MIRRLQSKDLAGSSLPVDDRRSCVEYLSAEGYSAAEIAGILSVADRTVLRDRQAIKEKNALERDPALAGQVAGQIIREADASMGRLRKLARDREAPHAARVDAERSAFGIFRDMVRTLQRLGYLPEAETRFSGDLTHRVADDSAPPDYEELRIEVERLEAIRLRHPSNSPGSAGYGLSGAPARPLPTVPVVPANHSDTGDGSSVDDELAQVKHLLTSLAAMDATRRLAERLGAERASNQTVHDTDDDRDGEVEPAAVTTTTPVITPKGKEA